MADLSYTVRYFSTIISPCLQFTSTTTIKIPPCGAHWGKIPAPLVRSRALCVRVAPMWRPVCGTVLGTVVNGRPSERSLSPHSERASQAAITFLPPLTTLPPSSHWMCPPTKLGTIKIYKHTLKWSENVEGEKRCRCVFEWLQPASSALFFPLTRIFSSNVLFLKKKNPFRCFTPVHLLHDRPFIWRTRRQKTRECSIRSSPAERGAALRERGGRDRVALARRRHGHRPASPVRQTAWPKSSQTALQTHRTLLQQPDKNSKYIGTSHPMRPKCRKYLWRSLPLREYKR